MKKKVLFILVILCLVTVFMEFRIWRLMSGSPLKIDLVFTGLVRGNLINKTLSTGLKEIDGKKGGGYTYYYSALCQEIRTAKRDHDGILLMDLGDNYYGTPLLYYNNGKLYNDLVSMLPEKGVILGGNLDCLYGIEVFEKRARESEWPILLSNVYEFGSDKRLHFTQTYVIKNIGGVSFGIIGYAPGNLDNSMVLLKRQRLSVEEDFDKLESVILQCREAGAEILVVISQYDFWRYPERLVKVKSFMDRFDIDIFAGLNFKEFSKETIQHKGRLITSFFGLNECTQLKNLQLEVDRKTHKIIRFEDKYRFVSSKDYPSERKVTEMINSEVSRIEDITEHKLAFITKSLKRDFYYSSPLGSFICDILKAKYKADIVLINSGSIRVDLNRGFVTTGSLFNVIPFDNMAVELTLPGSKIKELIVKAFSNNGTFQVSGVNFGVRKYEKESRNDYEIEYTRIDKTGIEDSRNYRVVINSFTYSEFQDLLNFTGNEVKFSDNIRKVIEHYLERIKYLEPEDYKPRFTETVIKEEKNADTR